MKGTLKFGSKIYVEQETGEEIEAQTIFQEASDSNFEKIWLAHILTSLNELGGKKIQVLSYLFKNRIISHNIVTKTVQEIATETGISYPTVSETLKILESNGLIKRKTGIIQLSPSMIFRGSHENRMRIMFEFRNVPKGKDTKELNAAPNDDGE
jgi:DNA-binding transcriptional ArsR family regulator